MKYIIVKEGIHELPIVFHEILSHAQVAGNKTVVSAGFCNIGIREEGGEPKWAAWGESYTLKIKSRGDVDDDILNSMQR